jgi:hypothetical protein
VADIVSDGSNRKDGGETSSPTEAGVELLQDTEKEDLMKDAKRFDSQKSQARVFVQSSCVKCCLA